MQFADDAEVARLTGAFLDRTLPKQHWTHAAHWAAALWLVATRGAAAHAEMPGLIRAYNEATGGPNTDAEGYHETITVASLAAAADAWATRPAGTGVAAVLGALLASPLGRSDWLLRHWSQDRLFSVEARRRWVAPDLEPLPWPVCPQD